MTTGPATISAATRRSILLLSFATFASIAAQRICDAMLPELSRTFAVSLTQAAQVGFSESQTALPPSKSPDRRRVWQRQQ